MRSFGPGSPPLRGTVHVPGDKSLSHRAVLFSAIADGVTHVAGVLDCGSDPSSSSRWANGGSAIIFTISALSLFTMGAGVPAGASTAYQLTYSNPGSVSFMAGTSGAAGERFGPPTPSALIFPAFANGSTAGMLLNMNCAWPPITSSGLWCQICRL